MWTEPSWMELEPLYEVPAAPLPLLPCEDARKRWSSMTRKEPSSDTASVSALILDFLASRTMRNAFFLFIGHPVYCIFIIAVKTGEVITHSISYILRIISFKVRKVPIPAHISPLLLVFKFEGRVQFCSSLYFFTTQYIPAAVEPSHNAYHVLHWTTAEWMHVEGAHLQLEHFNMLSYSTFPSGTSGKESAFNKGDPGSIPGLGRFPGEGPIPVFLPGESMDRGT